MLWAIGGVLVVAIGAAALVEPARFAVLNLFMSGSVEIKMIDDATLTPVENATVAIESQTVKTDKNGNATVKNLKFGSHNYSLSKETYTTLSGTLQVKPGTNFVGPLKFHSSGVPVEVRATNKLSGKTITTFTASIDQTTISAQANGEGLAIIKIPTNKLGKLNLKVKAEGLNDATQEITVSLSKQPDPVRLTMTPAGKHYFLSNRSGKIDVYSANLDGSDQTVVIKGSGSEDSTTTFSVAPDGKHGLMASKRANQRGPDGKLLNDLFAVDFEQKTIKRVDGNKPSIIVIGWRDGTNAVYTMDSNDITRDNNAELKIVDVTTGKSATLLTTYYLGSNPYLPKENTNIAYVVEYRASMERYGIFSIDLKTKNVKKIFDAPASLYQARFGYLDFEIDNKWHGINLATGQVKDSSAIDINNQKWYVPSPSGKKVAWVESRDGINTIIVGDQNGANGRQLTKDIKVATIKLWVSDDYIIFNGNSSNENADYIVSLDGETVTKISNVFTTTSNQYFDY